MSGSREYTSETARAAAQRDQLADWVVDFLSSPGSDNAPLGHELSERLGWWLGPVQLPIDDLPRLAGPPGAPVLQEVDEDEWRDDVDDLSRRIQSGHEPPPVIASYGSGQLVLEDGNHRVEAARRTGAREVWVVIGFSSSEERDGYLARPESQRS